MTRAPTEMELRVAIAGYDHMRLRFSLNMTGEDIPVHAWENQGAELRRDWIGAARAMIRAMREPTDEMIAEADRDSYHDDPSGPRQHWQAMVDAASPETGTAQEGK